MSRCVPWAVCVIRDDGCAVEFLFVCRLVRHGEGLAKAKAYTEASHAMYERVVSLFCP